MILKCKNNLQLLGTLHSELVFNKENNEIAIMRVFIVQEKSALSKFSKVFYGPTKKAKYKCCKVKKSEKVDELFK